MKKFKFNVNGMHCNSCVVLTESEIGELPHVHNVKASLQDCCVEVEGEFDGKSLEEVAHELSNVMEKHGYSVTIDKIEKKKVNWSEFLFAVPVAILFVGFFVLLQKLGVVNLANASSLGFGTAFLIGVVASVSTCMAVVGGLVLSLSANYSKNTSEMRPHFLFHGGRLVSFFFLGGLIGAIGASFSLSSTGMFIMTLLVAIVMFVLGINLLDVFPWAKKLQVSMPKFLSGKALGAKNSTGILAPLILGAVTFFLPCGFTQSMQVYTLTSGSFIRGGLMMFVFALGTLPVLLALSFGSRKLSEGKKSGVFFKAAGLVVIFFALLNFANALALMGLNIPLFY